MKVVSQKGWYKSKLYACSCGFGHTFLKVTYEDYDGLCTIGDDEQPSWGVEICLDDRRLIDRIKKAWRILLGRDTYLNYISIDIEDIQHLRNTANYWLERCSQGLIEAQPKE